MDILTRITQNVIIYEICQGKNDTMSQYQDDVYIEIILKLILEIN